MSTEPKTKLIELCSVSKRYPGTIALDGVDFDLLPGEVHALLGENGAGKSTLINIIAGTINASSGDYIYKGEHLGQLTPAQARHRGISAVFQEFSLVPHLTVEENIFLGREVSKAGILNQREMASRTVEILQSLQFAISPKRLVRDLSRAEQQMVEIAKALLFDPDVLILDEPTASLTEAETAILFAAIARLKKVGVGIIYVSHRMHELRAVADRVTILRDGRWIATVDTARTPDDELVSLMAGRQIEQFFPIIGRNPGAVRLEASNLTTADGTVIDASLTLRGGEIVGIGGLIGSGKSEFVRSLFGLEPLKSGTVVVDGSPVANLSPAEMIGRKVCYFPADRTVEGLALQRSILENASISSLDTPAIGIGPFLRKFSERSLVNSVTKLLSVNPRAAHITTGSLSGGNRQKVMLARGLMRPTDVFLFEEPTVGIDVGAKLDVYETIKKLVEDGSAVLIVSSDLPELLHLCHRVSIFSGGRITAQLEGDELNEEGALSHFFSCTDGPVSAGVLS